MKIKEVIVVEGKNDANVLKSYLDCDTIITNGTHIGSAIIKQIQMAKEKRGVIIFTDPDHPGEYIRKTINQKVPGCKNACIHKSKAHTAKKVGVEHASKEDIIDALSHLFTYEEDIAETLSWTEYCDLGLSGRTDSAKKREKIAEALYLGKPNAKTLYKRLNMLQMNQQEVEELLKEG